MAGGWRILGGLVCTSIIVSGGCVGLEEHRQLQMSQRILESEKARLEQELFDSRSIGESLRGRVVSLEDQLNARDLLVENLDSENDGLEAKFAKAQELIAKIADRPLEPIPMLSSGLPADLDSAIQQFASRNPSSVTYDREHGSLKWTSDLLFPFATDVVKESAAETLRRFGGILRSPVAGDFDVVVVGHTDNVRISRPETLKKHPTNWHLSVHRAISVGKILEKEGVSSSRIGVMGFGQHRPLVPNTTDENRARNRRVEMYMVPHGTFGSGIEPAATAMSFTGDKAKKPDDPTK